MPFLFYHKEQTKKSCVISHCSALIKSGACTRTMGLTDEVSLRRNIVGYHHDTTSVSWHRTADSLSISGFFLFFSIISFACELFYIHHWCYKIWVLFAVHFLHWCLCFRTTNTILLTTKSFSRWSPVLHCLQLSFLISVWKFCMCTALQSHRNNQSALSTYRDKGMHHYKNEGTSKSTV